MKYITIILLLVSPPLFAEYVPFSIKSVHGITGKGFIELKGPGKIELKKKIYNYEETVYISINKVSSLSEVSGVKKACIIRYTSGLYSENISVSNQSCFEVISQINKAR